MIIVPIYVRFAILNLNFLRNVGLIRHHESPSRGEPVPGESDDGDREVPVQIDALVPEIRMGNMTICSHIQNLGGHEDQMEEEIEHKGTESHFHGSGEGPDPDVLDAHKMNGEDDVLSDGEVLGVESEDDDGGEWVGPLVQHMVPVVVVRYLWESPRIELEAHLPEEETTNGSDEREGHSQDVWIPETRPHLGEFRYEILPLDREDEQEDDRPLIVACEVVEHLSIPDVTQECHDTPHDPDDRVPQCSLQ